MVTVLPVLLAARELRERYQGEKSEAAGELGWLKEGSLGGADAGRGGGRRGAGLFSLSDALRLTEGGESRVEFILGVVGGVWCGVVGVAGWSTIASFGETSIGVGWSFLERFLGEPAMLPRDVVW
jgi:hypothetical protein